MSKTTRVYLLLGSNLGNRLLQINLAKIEIETHCGMISTASKIYETAPWGDENQPGFLNQVIEIESGIAPADLLKQLQNIEKTIGREKTHKWGPRIIDIDILFYGELIIHTKDLIIPHPELHKRRFTLVPLAEIAPSFFHPGLNKTVKTLLDECGNTLDVYEYNYPEKAAG